MTTIEEILLNQGIEFSDLVDETGEWIAVKDKDRKNSVYLGMPQKKARSNFKATSRFEVNQRPKSLLSNYDSTSNGNTSNGRTFAFLESETGVLSRYLKSKLLINPISSDFDLRKPRVGTRYAQITETHHGIVLVELDSLLNDENALTAINDYAGLLQTVTTTNGVPFYVGEKSQTLYNKYSGFLIEHSGLFPNEGPSTSTNRLIDVNDTLTSLVFIQDFFEHCEVDYDSIRVTSFSYDQGPTPTMDGLTAMKVVALQEKFGYPSPEHIIFDIDKVSDVKDTFPQTFENGLEVCFGELRNITATSKTVFANDSGFSLSGKARAEYVKETKYYCQNVR
jgi:hypothetical protein